MIPGTHASGNLLAYLAFNRFVLDTPLYRESYRILDEKMRVSRESKIAIYCYEDGSRSYDALKHILGDSRVSSLQSDGYNVYIYLDDRLMDTEHLCCMAYARAKFKYAFGQSDDRDAGYILGCMGELYDLEREYEQGKLSPEQIHGCRQGLKTKEIMGTVA